MLALIVPDLLLIVADLPVIVSDPSTYVHTYWLAHPIAYLPQIAYLLPASILATDSILASLPMIQQNIYTYK